jgi:EmrB/QacA subfamily drug resistance transporter
VTEAAITFEERPSEAPVQVDPRARTEILLAILAAMFLSALDQTIVGTALPRIVNDLKGNELYTWVVTIYLLTSTVTGPIYGKLSDLFGRRPMIMIGVGLFLLGSALSGLSQEMWQLIAARGIQGLGAGAIFPIALAVIGDLFTPAERGKYQGLFGAVFGVAALIGPALGGLLTDTVGWHWVFFVNLPVGGVVLVVIWHLMPRIKHPERVRSIDYLGAAVFTAAIVPILIGLTNKRELDWTDPLVGGLILAGLALTAVFVWVESRAKEPIIPLSLFSNRTIAVSLVIVFLAAIGFFGAIIFLPQWFQVVAGSSATESGYQTLPLLAGLIFGSVASGQVIARTGRYRWMVVGALFVISIGLFLMTSLRADTSLPVLWFWMALTGIGIGPTMAAFTVIIQNAAPVRQLGTATSALAFFRQVGGTVGLSVAGTLFGTALTREIPTQMAAAGVPSELASRFAGMGTSSSELNTVGDLGAQILANVPAPYRDQVEPFIPNIVNGFHQAFSLAITAALWVGVGAALVSGLLALGLLPELPLRRHHEPETVPARAGSEPGTLTPEAPPILE